MAVYTKVSGAALAGFLEGFALGRAVSLTPIAEGVSNSNYVLETEAGRFILTLFEARTREEDLPFFMGLMRHLAEKGLKVPLPVADASGALFGSLCGRAAALTGFLDGAWPRDILPGMAGQVGAALAGLHLAGRDFEGRRDNDLGLSGWRRLTGRLGGKAAEIEPGLDAEIAKELAALEAGWPEGLPRGAIHADLFPDNVFFDGGGTLSGLIDFYFACTDFLAYDLAVCLNAWCFDEERCFLPGRAAEMIAGYEAARPLSASERDALPLLCRGGAMRFLATRAHDWIFRPKDALVTPKDPMDYVARSRFFRNWTGA
jgi:homoserine kinase type II